MSETIRLLDARGTEIMITAVPEGTDRFPIARCDVPLQFPDTLDALMRDQPIEVAVYLRIPGTNFFVEDGEMYHGNA